MMRRRLARPASSGSGEDKDKDGPGWTDVTDADDGGYYLGMLDAGRLGAVLEEDNAAQLAILEEAKQRDLDAKALAKAKSKDARLQATAENIASELKETEQVVARLLESNKNLLTAIKDKKCTAAEIDEIANLIATDTEKYVYSWAPAEKLGCLQRLRKLSLVDLNEMFQKNRTRFEESSGLIAPRQDGTTHEGALEKARGKGGLSRENRPWVAPHVVYPKSGSGDGLGYLGAAWKGLKLAAIYYDEDDPQGAHLPQVGFVRHRCCARCVGLGVCLASHHRTGQSARACPWCKQPSQPPQVGQPLPACGTCGGRRTMPLNACPACRPDKQLKGCKLCKGTRTVEPDGVPDRGETAYYRVLDDGSLSVFWFDARQSKGEGGNGLARADAVSEVRHAWTGNRLLGLSLGLEAQSYHLCKAHPKDIDALHTKLAKEGFHLTNIPIQSSTTDLSGGPLQASRASDGDGSTLAQPHQFRVGGSEIVYFHQYLVFSGLKKKGKKTKDTNKKELKKNRPLTPAEAWIAPATRAFKGLINVTEDDEERDEKKQKGAGADRLPIRLVSKGNRRKRTSQAKVFGGASAEQVYSANVGKKPRSAQEWCHLRGHGDGGLNTKLNLVAGSVHCNTEQLAIETAQRRRKSEIGLNVTAYLRAPDVAEYMRYKLYRLEKSGSAVVKADKIFDHIFDGQSEGFDYHQFRLLETTVERVVHAAENALGTYVAARNLELAGRLGKARPEELSERYQPSDEWIRAISVWMELRCEKEHGPSGMSDQEETKDGDGLRQDDDDGDGVLRPSGGMDTADDGAERDEVDEDDLQCEVAEQIAAEKALEDKTGRVTPDASLNDADGSRKVKRAKRGGRDDGDDL